MQMLIRNSILKLKNDIVSFLENYNDLIIFGVGEGGAFVYISLKDMGKIFPSFVIMIIVKGKRQYMG